MRVAVGVEGLVSRANGIVSAWQLRGVISNARVCAGLCFAAHILQSIMSEKKAAEELRKVEAECNRLNQELEKLNSAIPTSQACKE